MKNYILVGLGPHAKRIYYPFLEKYHTGFGIRVKLLVELKHQSTAVAKFLNNRKLQPEKILYLEDTKKNILGLTLDPVAKKELNKIVEKSEIDGIIISTEPKAHKIYVEWALKNNINVLMDKPITAPLFSSTNKRAAKKIYKDYLDLDKLRKKSKAKVYVVCQRRNHPGYVFIKNYLTEFIRKFGVPITYIDIYHADGAWSLPHEFNKENHSYKYGYGKLMHSGYHFVDLFAWLSQANIELSKARPDKIRMYTARFSPNDLFNQLDEKTLGKFFKSAPIKEFYNTYKSKDYKDFGELDAYTLVQLLRGKNVVTTGTINLQQNSFSRRGWANLPVDTYKGNGRVRHERVNIQVSHFLNIQVHSYQSNESGKRDVLPGEIGSADHFDIFIFRNTKMIGGKPFEKISVGKDLRLGNMHDPRYLGHNEYAREITFLNFIKNKEDNSELQYHNFTNKLLSEIYTSISQGQITGNSQINFKI